MTTQSTGPDARPTTNRENPVGAPRHCTGCAGWEYEDGEPVGPVAGCPGIEAEAASPVALDVERLTLAMCRAFHGEDCAVTQYDAEQADQVAAEYARLTEQEDRG